MQEFFTGLSPEVVGQCWDMLIIGIVVISVFGVFQWRKVRQAGMETTLKQQMLELGMSPYEIAQVLSASPSKVSKHQPAGHDAHRTAHLTERQH